MNKSKGKILFISSADPFRGPGSIALNYIRTFERGGYEVEFLTKFKIPSNPEIKYVFKKKSKFNNLSFRLWRRFKRIDLSNEYSFFYRRENKPPVPIKRILQNISDDYDYIVIFFWQSLLSYASVEAIYDKMRKKPKVIYLCADYSPMTGGCHFMGDCKNYKEGCGRCPVIRSTLPSDFTAKNMNDRVRINAKIKPLVLSNRYMKSFFEQSPAMNSGAVLASVPIVIDTELYKPLDKTALGKKYNIDENDFIILFGCQNLSDERKGMRYLLSALNIFNEMISVDQRKKIKVITVGHITKDLIEQIPFEQKHFGFVTPNVLPEIYSLSTVFLCPSVNDAGPSMVNQSIACGTPVIAFEMGTALEVIKDTGAGFCVPLKDMEAFAKAIEKICSMDSCTYQTVRKKCRTTALHYHSGDYFLNIFEKLP